MALSRNELDSSERARRQKAMDAAFEILGEAGFDVAICAATWLTEDGETATMVKSFGNWYAQNGVIKYVYERRMHGAKMEAEDEHEATCDDD